MKVTVYNFFKMGNTYQFVKNDILYTLTAETFVCMARQYEMMGYRKIETESFVSYAKVENEIACFMKELMKG
jgi:hypothetical protein